MRYIIASADENWLIGKDGKLPWHIPVEMWWFKQTTWGSAVIMGRKTFESLPRQQLPSRYVVVISRNQTFVYADACATTVEEAFEAAKYANHKIWREPIILDDRIFVIGGAEIYKYCLDNNLIDKMLISKVKGCYEGDTYFPKFDENRWSKTIIKQFQDFDVIEYGLSK